MKKLLSVLLSTIISISLFTPIYAENDNTYDANSNTEEIMVSEVMTFNEMVECYAKEMGISLIQAYKEFSINDNVSLVEAKAATYRELAVGLGVTETYRPSIRFYCNTSESGNYWGITSIYKVTLNRTYNGISKQFDGEVDAWLRSAYQIEWMANGDFYNNATQSFGASVTGDFKLNDSIHIDFGVSGSTSSNHYAYYYWHTTTSFQ